MEQLEQTVEQPAERYEPELGATIQRMERQRRRAMRLGDKVRLRKLGTQGIVIALGEEEAEIQVGMMRVRTRLADLELVQGESADTTQGEGTVRLRKTTSNEAQSAGDLFPQSPGMELDLRGQRAEDALETLERYLDAAYLAGMPFVRIIHGKGTGRLREVIRQALSQTSQVKSFEAGGEKEGGDGVTVAKLAT
jgi:DNA mismatch repair protein MutS2